MKVLLICDDYWHPGQTAIDGIEPLKQQGFEFDVMKNADNLYFETLKKYPVILMCKSDEIPQTGRQPWRTEAAQKTFAGYVENGGGLTAVHSALVNSETPGELDQLIGCRFLGHPDSCPVTVQCIKPHPVTEDVEQFCETDEHYRIVITQSDADILAASYSPPQGKDDKHQEDQFFNTHAAIYPACYVRTHGKGRVCVISSGHFSAVWLNLQFQRLLSNAIKWTSGG